MTEHIKLKSEKYGAFKIGFSKSVWDEGGPDTMHVTIYYRNTPVMYMGRDNINKQAMYKRVVNKIKRERGSDYLEAVMRDFKERGINFKGGDPMYIDEVKYVDKDENKVYAIIGNSYVSRDIKVEKINRSKKYYVEFKGQKYYFKHKIDLG